MRRIFLHLLFWLAYALYDGYLGSPMTGPSFEHLSFGERLLIGYKGELCLLVFKIPAVYLVLNYLVPNYLRNKNLVVLVAGFVATAAAVTVINQQVWYQFIYPYIYEITAPEPAKNFSHAVFRLTWSSFDSLMLLGVTSSLKFFRMRLKASEREQELVAEKLQSELNFLRAQTNPHFLFNTLNNLYHLARKRSETTPEAILKLSGLLRFMLYECATPRILISQEIKVIEDYIELERLRYGQRLQVDFQRDIADENQEVAPLLLLPFVENAFKHGASESRGETWVKIFLKVKNATLDLRVENPAESDGASAVSAQRANSTTGAIGLKNVKRQLELIYPEHSLTIEQREGIFVAHLHVPLGN